MRVDAVDEPIEVFPQSRVGPCSVRGLKENVNRAIELGLRAIEVAHFQLSLAGVEVRLRGRNERGNRIGRGRQ